VEGLPGRTPPFRRRAGRPEQHTHAYLHAQIAARVEAYLAVGKHGAPKARFFLRSEDVLPQIEVAFVTWKQVVEANGDPALDRFNGWCRRFNR
jgi:hypothetical protein